MNAEAFICRANSELAECHGVHTLLLYGSRADGLASDDSDFDLAAFASVETVIRYTRLVDGSYLDAFVYPESVLVSSTEEHLKLRGSKVLVQLGSQGTAFLERLEGLYGRAPEPLPLDESAARRLWAYKMIARAKCSDADENYRRAWLLTALLEDYFRLRGKWFEGPKKALRWLAQFDRPAFEAFSLALEPGASLPAVAHLVPLVLGAQGANHSIERTWSLHRFD